MSPDQARHMVPGCFKLQGLLLLSLTFTRESNRRFRRLATLLSLLLLLSSLPPSARYLAPARAAQDEGRFYPQTGNTLAPQFVQFFDSNGGLPLFGYPVTDAAMDGGYLVQWSERERLEWHPENAGTQFEVE